MGFGSSGIRHHVVIGSLSSTSSVVQIDTRGDEVVEIEITAGLVSTNVSFEATRDGVNWQFVDVVEFREALRAVLSSVQGDPGANGTGAFRGRFYCAGAVGFRVRRVFFTSGSATVRLSAGVGAFEPDPVRNRLGAGIRHQLFVTAQSGANLVFPSSGEYIGIHYVRLAPLGGATGGRAILWFGATADTIYNAGTDQPLFASTFPASATLPTDAHFWPLIRSKVRGHDLKITTDADVALDVIVAWQSFF